MDGDCITITGKTLSENLEHIKMIDENQEIFNTLK